MRKPESFFIHARLKSGKYTMNKLASAGLTLLMVMLLSRMLPIVETPWMAKGTDVAISPEIWVYSYAMLISIATDAILAVMPPINRLKQATMYAAASYVTYYCLFIRTPEFDGYPELAAVAGVCTVLIFFTGKRLFSEQSLLTPVFALLVPLICMFFL
ncbi:hypothetical protein G8C92_28845 [Paenibacillus donghaensis]|uniref:hypothetical protein n=1 Tax=Paenibacillus donghaensis TaxID=414771 RepID=UPI0018839550|nr:hypothetical protein [Paenibacillus donghaensis]MBE9918012.1 hypothetical protein [Paenibacillus donghaensis]